MTYSGNDARSVVHKTILRLRADSEQRSNGDLIGSEEDLIKRYGVSRPTLRQAAALVTQEQLIKVKRGVAGGYFASRPNVSAVSHMAAIYLKSRGTDAEELLHAVELIRRDMVRMAASIGTDSAKAELRAFLEADEADQAAGYGYRKFAEAERIYADLLGRLCGSEVLHLFLQILLELLGWPGEERQMPNYTPDRLAISLQRRSRIVRAILEGDAEIAMLEVDRGMRQFAEWRAEDKAIG